MKIKIFRQTLAH